jgi:hypothetical protein
MWETAERAGVVTANLMWYVTWKLFMDIVYGVFLGQVLPKRPQEHPRHILFLGRY